MERKTGIVKFDPPLKFGTLLRRYKRFLADIGLEDGTVATAHCPNTGRMTSCAEPGWRVALSDSRNPQRKHRYTWELVHNGVSWICVNTGRANEVAFEAVSAGVVPALAGYDDVLREQRFGDSRFDLLLKRGSEQCFVEVKSVTLLAGDGCHAFPDAVTERGRKHLHDLADVVKAGHRAAMLYVILRPDGTVFRVAREIDPAYAAALDHAVSAGVEVHAWRAAVSTGGIHLSEAVRMH